MPNQTRSSDEAGEPIAETEIEFEDVWAADSYATFARHYLSMAGQLVEAAGVKPNDRVLDVGCGTGNVTITAARRGAQVVGLDIAPSMLERAGENAEIAGVDGIDWREGSASALPFDDGTFDVTLSSLGHMYGEPADAAARELRRVTRPGGRVGFTAWTPTSLYPAMAQVLVTYLSPADIPDVSEPPFTWGETGTVERRLEPGVDRIEFDTGTVSYPAASPAHFWEETAANSGIFVELLETVSEDDRSALRAEMIETIEPRFDDGENAVSLEYLRTTATVSTDEDG